MIKNKSEYKWLYIITIIVFISFIGLLVGVYELNQVVSRYNTARNLDYDKNSNEVFNIDDHSIDLLDSEMASNNKTTTEDLIYIIEEEKLAHDVYVAMYELWGTRIFDNISNSESTHQNLVLSVMKSRDLADPRSDEVGVFIDRELQSLYDQLIEQGSLSQQDALEVGVLVEETDITDLERIISNLDPIDVDIYDVLTNLLSGSNKHLDSFNRQIDR